MPRSSSATPSRRGAWRLMGPSGVTTQNRLNRRFPGRLCTLTHSLAGAPRKIATPRRGPFLGSIAVLDNYIYRAPLGGEGHWVSLTRAERFTRRVISVSFAGTGELA